MRRIIFLMPLILIFLFSHCDRGGKNPEVETIVLKESSAQAGIRFTKEISTPFEDIAYPFLFLDGDQVCVYGYNSEKSAHNKVVRIYNRQLEMINKMFFNTGLGPGDLYGASMFFPIGDRILVADHQLRRISVFDKKLEYIDMIKTDQPFVSVNISDDGKYVLYSRQRARNSRKEGRTLDFYITPFPDLKRTHYHHIGPFFPYVLTVKPGKFIIGEVANYHYFIKAEKVYFLNMATYEIINFALSGNMLKRVRVEVDEIPVPPEKEREWLRDQVGDNPRILDRVLLADTVQPASWMVPLKKGFVVVRRRTYQTGCRDTHEGDYFDYDLKLRGKIQIPCFRNILILENAVFPYSIRYQNGYIYLIREGDENFTLEKWRVEGE